MSGYNFTESVRRVLAAARDEAAQLRHEYVGTEHILLAVSCTDGTVALTVLEQLGVAPDGLRQDVLALVTPGRADRERHDLPYTSRAKKVLELATTEARRLGAAYVGSEHLLLGLVAEEKGIGAQLLLSRGVTLKRAREETQRATGSSAVDGAESRVQRPLRAAMTFGLNERARQIMTSAFELANARGSRTVAPAHAAHASSVQLALALLGGAIETAPVFAAHGVSRARFVEELAAVSG